MAWWQMVLFLGAFVGILGGAHAFVYVSVVRFFSVVSVQVKWGIITALVFFALGYFLSSAIAHWQDNLFTRSWYFFSGFWLGWLTNLVIGFGLAWILVAIGSHAGWTGGHFSFVGSVVLVASFLLSVYGTWNALHFRVRDITVTIRNLPMAWEGKKIVQISDVHLGHVYKAPFLTRVVDQINVLQPDMVLITGDLFDGMDGLLEPLVAPLNVLHSSYGTFFVTGNHETYLGTERALAVLGTTPVRVLQDEAVDVNGLQVVGVGFPERKMTKDLGATLLGMSSFHKGVPTLLLYHSPTEIEAAKAAGVNLQLSGHTHKGQIFPFGFVTSLLYRGYDYGLRQEGDYAIYTTNGVGTWGPTMRIGNTPEIVSITLTKK